MYVVTELSTLIGTPPLYETLPAASVMTLWSV